MRGNFVLLRAGALRLLVRQEEVGAAHYMDGSGGPDARRYEAISDEMKPMPGRPKGRFIATGFLGAAEDILWCWDELRVLIDIELDCVPIPPALRSPSSPVEAYVIVEGEPVFLCRAAEVLRFAFAAEV